MVDFVTINTGRDKKILPIDEIEEAIFSDGDKIEQLIIDKFLKFFTTHEGVPFHQNSSEEDIKQTAKNMRIQFEKTLLNQPEKDIQPESDVKSIDKFKKCFALEFGAFAQVKHIPGLRKGLETNYIKENISGGFFKDIYHNLKKEIIFSQILMSFWDGKIFNISKNVNHLLLQTKNKIGFRQQPFSTCFLNIQLNHLIPDAAIYGLWIIQSPEWRGEETGNLIIFCYKPIIIEESQEQGTIEYKLDKETSKLLDEVNRMNIQDGIKETHNQTAHRAMNEQLRNTTMFDYFVINKFGNLGIPQEGTKLEKRYLLKIAEYVCNFLDFLNHPEVNYVHISVPPALNEVRLKKNKLKTLDNVNINISGKLLKYINDLETFNLRNAPCHSFWVRGHYQHFWNKQRFKIVYALTNEQLKAKGYQKDEKEIISKWRLPHIKGKGILINKDYSVK